VNLTSDELQIVIAANGHPHVDIPIRYPDGKTVSERFCGTCGRIICNPDCPSQHAPTT
jgi:hypothetical protein